MSKQATKQAAHFLQEKYRFHQNRLNLKTSKILI